MKLDGIDIDSTLKEMGSVLSNENDLSPALRSMIGVLILLVKLLSHRMGLNSRNSSKPPSSDINRPKNTRKKSNKKPGGQKGHPGSTLRQIETPDEVELICIDRRTLPKGRYRDMGVEKRQVFDIEIVRHVIEYQAQILEDTQGKRFVAPFPAGVNKAVQYGNTLKAHAVYLSQYQLLPYQRIQEYFGEQLHIPLSQGSLFNFNKEAFAHLADFSAIVKARLAGAERVHVDETGINIEGKRHWLHCASNDCWTDFFAHEKRGCQAMDGRGILPRFTGVLCHDHWKPYYRYTGCSHALCNAHHVRELSCAHEQDEQAWAGKMKTLLEQMNHAVHDGGGSLGKDKARRYRLRWRPTKSEFRDWLLVKEGTNLLGWAHTTTNPGTSACLQWDTVNQDSGQHRPPDAGAGLEPPWACHDVGPAHGHLWDRIRRS